MLSVVKRLSLLGSLHSIVVAVKLVSVARVLKIFVEPLLQAFVLKLERVHSLVGLLLLLVKVRCVIHARLFTE